MPFRLLPIARPCRASFDAMPGDEKVRFCAECGRHVYDLTMHTEAEGRALFDARKGQRTCVRFAKDETGAVRFKVAALAAAVAMAACSTHAAERGAEAPTCAIDTGDRDLGDTIPDVGDACPDVPAGANDGDADGCPDAGDAGVAPVEPTAPPAEPWFPPNEPAPTRTDGN